MDGNLLTSCAMTHIVASTQPWLLVDLEAEYQVFYVMIANNGAFTRSEPVDIRVGNSNANGGISNPFCVEKCKRGDNTALKRFDCPPGTKGRYVSFHTPPAKSHLDLCELEVYGIPPF